MQTPDVSTSDAKRRLWDAKRRLLDAQKRASDACAKNKWAGFSKKGAALQKRRIWFREVIFEKAFKKGPLETPVRIYVHKKTRASIWIRFLTRKRGWFCYESRVSWLYPGYAAKPIIDNHGNSASGSIGPSEVPPAQSECSPKRQIRPVTKISTALMAKCKHRRMIWNMKCEIWKMKYETWQDMSRCEIWNVRDWYEIWDMRYEMWHDVRLHDVIGYEMERN